MNGLGFEKLITKFCAKAKDFLGKISCLENELRPSTNVKPSARALSLSVCVCVCVCVNYNLYG